MTETSTEPPTADPPPQTGPSWPQAGQLYRDPKDREVAGVCAALARWTETDRVIWRIVVVVLAIFGGTGLALYVAGWLLIPKRGHRSPVAESWNTRTLTPAAAVVLGLVALVLVVSMDDTDGLIGLGVLATVGYLVYRERTGKGGLPAGRTASAEPSSYPTPVTPVEAPPYTASFPAPFEASLYDPAYGMAAWPATPEPAPTRRRSRLGAITLSIAALACGALVLARTYGADSLTAPRVLAVLVLLVGAGLVVGTWWGRARWLVVIGAGLSLALAASAAAGGVLPAGALNDGLGERRWSVSPIDPEQEFRLGVGEATLDLRGLRPGSPVAVKAQIGVGHLIVLLPSEVPLRVDARVELGDVGPVADTTGDGSNAGPDGGRDIEWTMTYGSGDPRAEVDVTVGTGQVEVRRG